MLILKSEFKKSGDDFQLEMDEFYRLSNERLISENTGIILITGG